MTYEFNPDWMCTCGDLTILGVVHRKDGPCYIPENREWVGLTDEEKEKIFYYSPRDSWLIIKNTEAKLREKNSL